MVPIKSRKFSTKASDYSTFDLVFIQKSFKEGLKVLGCKSKSGFQATNAGTVVIICDEKLDEAVKKHGGEQKKIAVLADSDLPELALNLLLESYSFSKFKSDPKRSSQTITILSPEKLNLAPISSKADSICFARDLVNTPASSMTPQTLASLAKRFSKNLTIKVYTKSELEKLGCGGILSVSQGSKVPPALIHLRYGPKNAKKSLCMIGKGVTFDSGGYSLKSPRGMSEMKCDMAGAAAVMGAFHNLSKKKPKQGICIHGLIPCSENMVNSIATKPGDVYEAMNGTTVEVLNTDAEGRLLLADAICFAQKKLKVSKMVTVATLTGAAVAALGEEYAALLGNERSFNKKIMEGSSENLWELPLADEYKSKLKSKVADIKNNPGSPGAITAALFLEHFVEKSSTWAHLDIAGPAFVKGEATGFGVETLLALTNKL